MKKLIFKLIVFIAIIALFIVPVSVSVDPYNVFHYMAPRDNGIESNKGFIKTEYIKRNHDEIEGLVFGSSRAGFVDIGYLEQKMGIKFYDMASSESLVKEQVDELNVLIDAGYVPKHVIVMVDDISCFVDPLIHESMLYRVPYPSGSIFDKAEFYLKYMDLFMIADSISVIKDNESKRINDPSGDPSYDSSTGLNYLQRYYTTGTERLDKVSQFNPDEPQYQEAYWVDYYDLRVDEAVADMQAMVNLCDSNGIELTVVTNPLYHLTYAKGIENGYIEYLEKLASVTDYYNFSGFNAVTENYGYYYETSHFTPEVTRLMVDSIADGQDESYGSTFGKLITSDNVRDFVTELKTQAFERNIPVYENESVVNE